MNVDWGLGRWFRIGCVVGVVSSCTSEHRDDLAGDTVRALLGERVPQVAVLAWDDSGSVWFQRYDLFFSGRVGEAVCDSAGIYRVSSQGRITQVKAGDALCQLWKLERTALSPSRESLLYANPFEGGTIAKLSLRDQKVKVVAKTCLPLTNSPTWSPDGNRIAFSANCLHQRGKAFIYLMEADGSAMHPLGPAVNRQAEREPSWAPDGKSLVFVRGEGSNTGDIVVADTVLGRQRRLARGYAPSWSPTNNWIAYLVRDTLTKFGPEIHVIRPDGTEERTVLSMTDEWRRTASQAGTPDRASWITAPLVWSPDGLRLAFGMAGKVWSVAVDEAAMPLIEFGR